ncbi:class I SAM-dependent methyltransferase [Sulfoacidibacillus ferrooxidans]|uniref:Ubiquinone/menaquinone biosynthesis C-methyltransferase UbiE n=1 Tax=Sulfoacidibacillus ferrooxidans TaxID=2005001 RepID=A0A9X2AEY4_9BACL|nr:class I SAM-dependent methyltransferase [Sulfoacidibacillus ferrooxidans]MCI0183491.1 Ubiquinone/menaquinone biosynthesis C-methyltransferase UbiE [Sulfoacidibacillus ferrooxidans]
MNEDRFALIDETYSSYIGNHPELHDRWLLLQTVYTGKDRRSVYPFLPLPKGAAVLDVGTGFGALATEIAYFAPVAVTGVDVDVEKLKVAQVIAQAVAKKASQTGVGNGGLDAIPTFVEGDVYHLPFADDSFDLVISRFLFQHLQDPRLALKELFRVVRSGGLVCLIDIDEGLTIAYPEVPVYRALHEAFIALQARRGGDRMIGRKLAVYMQEANFNGIHSVAQVHSSFSPQVANDIGRQFTLRKLQEVRDEIVLEGLMTRQEYDSYYSQYESSVDGWSFDVAGHVTVFGVKP